MYRPADLARAMTNLLEDHAYPVTWTSKGPVALVRPSYRSRRLIRRYLERIQNKQSLAATQGRRGRPGKPGIMQVYPPPLFTGETASSRRTVRLKGIRELALLNLEIKELKRFQGVPKSTAIAQAAAAIGVSRSTLHRLLHATSKRLTWDTARKVRGFVTEKEWTRLQRLMFPPRSPWTPSM